MLNSQLGVIGVDELSRGTVNYSIIDPREVFKCACLCNSTSIMLAHNQPSGDPTPSPEDIESTKKIKEASSILGINLVDHVIIGHERYSSLTELGLI
jgi:DNA repair protein RadC